MVRFRPEAPFADLAHPVERHLAKVKVASSSLVIRSTNQWRYLYRYCHIRHHSQGVRQRSATPLSPVQIWVVPPKNSKSSDLEFFYPSRQAGYIFTRERVYHRHRRISSHELCITVGLMIYKILFWWYAIPCGIDDIQCLRIDLLPLLCYTKSKRWFYEKIANLVFVYNIMFSIFCLFN